MDFVDRKTEKRDGDLLSFPRDERGGSYARVGGGGKRGR